MGVAWAAVCQPVRRKFTDAANANRTWHAGTDPTTREPLQAFGHAWSVRIEYRPAEVGSQYEQTILTEWPLRAMAASVEKRGGLPVPGALRPNDGIVASLRRFAMIPVWPGFAIDVAFYASGLWVAIFAPLTLRGVVRRRRGRCVACGCPVGDHGHCPECGPA